LGAFLKARRSGIAPAAAGIAVSGGRRRVAGLRREEVAQLAMISADYYTRLEQGRLGGASVTVLDALATVLCLGPDERTYLFRLANKSERHTPRRPRVEHVTPQNKLLLDNLRDSPAMVLGRYLDILAWNRLAAAVFTDFGAVPRRDRNFLRMLFLDPSVRGRYVDWPSIARICVGYVRAAASDASEARLTDLVGDLSVSDPDFRTWWAERYASYQTHGTKALFHPKTGQYLLDWQILQTAFEQQTLLVMTVPSVGDSLEVLHILDSWSDRSNSQQARFCPDRSNDIGDHALASG